MILSALAGIKTNVLIGVSVAFIALLSVTGILTYKVLQLKEENGVIQATLDQKTQDVLDLNAQLIKLQQENKRVNEIILQTQQASEAVEASELKRSEKVRSVYETDSESKSWGDGTVPKPVTDLLFDF